MIQSLYVRHFRNIEEAYLEFHPQVNLLHGANAQGKTNFLEAIVLLSTGRSFRTQRLGELIALGANFFFLEAQIVRNKTTQLLRLSFDGENKHVECNATRHASFQPLLGNLPSILYAPSDSELITGSPTTRRRFLNLHLAQCDPLYVHHLFRFWRAHKQRNSLLRHSHEGIECWEQEMASSATYLAEQRVLLIKELNSALQQSCALLSSEPIVLQYTPSQPLDAAHYLAQLHKHRPREAHLGLTLTGPHRDDFTLHLDNKPARLYASEGQKRTAIAALRLAEYHRLGQQIDAPPLFGLDDLELHLDVDRRARLQQALGHLGQVFVTTPASNPDWGHRKLLIQQGTAVCC